MEYLNIIHRDSTKFYNLKALKTNWYYCMNKYLISLFETKNFPILIKAYYYILILLIN